MSIIQGNAHTSAGGGYQIERSLRFNSADSAYLNRTPASAGNRRTFTWSGWVKRGALSSSASYFLFAAGSFASSTNTSIRILNDSINIYWGGTGGPQWTATAVLRDPSAWYHLVFAFDTTQATFGNRLKLYVNGVQSTVWSLQETGGLTAQNSDLYINNNQQHNLGASGTPSSYFDGYMTEINFIDGSAKTPSDFGETDSATGVWKPKAYSGTYGTNGFYLKFSDNSGTTSTTLGKDSSGNGNNWTPNNFSVTAGAGNDSMVDSPTAYGTDTGAGGEVRGNYCTLNPLSKSSSSGTTPNNGNLDIAATATATDYMTTMFVSSGKWYFEVLVNQVDTSTPSGNPSIGIQGQGFPASGPKVQVDTSGALTVDGSTTGSSFFTYTSADIIGVAFDMGAKKAWFSKNGTYYNSGDPAAGTNATGTWSASGEVAPFIRTRGNASASFNAGQRAFAYTAPSGFKALCTTNLPTPTIGATSTTQANDYFNTVLYTGNGSNGKAVTGVGFQPDAVWAKCRSNSYHHFISDAVRTAAKVLSPSQTAAESSWSDNSHFASFDSDGFTLNSNSGVNANAETYVAWNWNAGGSNATNTSGTITSTVRANTTSGFSIVTYTGTGANATVGHGLGVAPSMIILKGRTNADQWFIWHNTFTSSQYIYFNTTAVVSGANPWNSTLPTSTLFSLGTDAGVNGNTTTYVAYCFAPVAGYSAFGSYTGNGSSDGPFVFTNFRPRYVMYKRTDTTGNWIVYDTARNTYNVVDSRLSPNLSDAEGTASASRSIDIISNGFKLRGASVDANASGGTYIYMAIAESPFKYSLGR